jgi:hypothetical protein
MNPKLLEKVAGFIKLAINQTGELEADNLALRKKLACEAIDQEKYELALHKTADALYDSDFITDETEKKTFLRKAAEDPVYVVRFLEKVCEQADVAQMGKPARIKAVDKEASLDPVMMRAFGYHSAAGLVDE